MAEYDELLRRAGKLVSEYDDNFDGCLGDEEGDVLNKMIDAVAALQARVDELEKQKKEAAEALKMWQTYFAKPTPNRIRQLKGEDNG